MIAVLDASAFAPIVIPDEQESLLPDLQHALEAGEMVVPSHWHLEVANLLLVARRRGRIAQSDQEYAAKTMDAIMVEVDSASARRAMGEIWQLAERHQVTIYDAAYLELAASRNLALATSDNALIAAARRESVKLFGR